jgi:hypothetical protein
VVYYHFLVEMKHLGQTRMSDLLNYSSRTDILVCLIVYFELGNNISLFYKENILVKSGDRITVLV